MSRLVALARWVDALVLVLVLLDALSAAGNQNAPGNAVAEILTAAVLLVFAAVFHAWLWRSEHRKAPARCPPEGLPRAKATREEEPE